MDEKQTINEIRTAILNGDIERVVLLLTTNGTLRDVMTPFGTWLHVAAKHGKLELVKFLIGFGIGVNVRGGILDGAALCLAASQGHLDVVEYLISQAAELDVSEPNRNPLFGAIYGGHTDVAKFLIEKGIDAHVKYNGENMKDMDALAFAHEWGRTEIAKLLMGNMK